MTMRNYPAAETAHRSRDNAEHCARFKQDEDENPRGLAAGDLVDDEEVSTEEF